MNIINEMLVDKCFPDNVNARAVVPAYKDKTASGNPITLTDSEENKPLNMKLYGWSKQDGEPTPDNPVGIESAGMKWSTGAQLFDASKLDGMSLYGVTLHIKDGIIYAEGEATENAWITVNLTKDEIQRLFEDGKYTITQQKFGNVNFDAGLYFRFIPSTFRNGTIELAMPESIKDGDVYYFLNITKGVKHTGGIRVMLNKGDTDLPYEPYTGGIPKFYGDKVGLSVRGKNLFHITKESDCDKAYDNTTKRIILPGEYLIGLSSNNYYIAHDAFIDFKTNNISFVYSGKSGVGIGTNCQKGKTYAFSFETNKGAAYAVFYSEDGTHKASVLISTYNVFVIPDYVEHVVILLTNNDGAVAGDTIWFKNVQIEEAKSVTAYEPYRTPQSTAIVTPNGLSGIPVPSNTAGITYTDADGQSWIADEIDLERGKYVQRVWQAEFDGSNDEAWVLYKSVQYLGFAIKVLPHQKMMRRYGLCTQYKTENLPTSNEAIWIGVNNNVLYVKNSRFYDASLDDEGLSNFKAHLAANPLVVMTYLDTPIERDLTSAELAEYTQLYSYKPTTVLENDSDCWMDVTYKAGTSGKSKNEALRWYFKNVMPLVG